MEVVDERGQPLPIADEPVPTNVIGFKLIKISYLNQSAINFVHLFDQLFSRISTCLAISEGTVDTSSFIAQELMPMLNGRIFAINFWESNDFSLLRQVEPHILIQCPFLRYIELNDIFFFNFPGQDIETASDSEAVAKWLFMPRPREAAPKLLHCYFINEMEWEGPIMEARTAFTEAKSAAPFIIGIYQENSNGIEPFDITNHHTNEQMVCKQRKDGFWMLTRSPTGKNDQTEEQWKIWEAQATDEHFLENLWNRIEISAKKDCARPDKARHEWPS